MNRESLCQSVFALALQESDKAAFEEALNQAPDLVSKESDPLQFIRFAGGSHAAAAKRLVEYWRTRQTTFGDAFMRPLDLSGNGALSEDDVETLKTGFIKILPDDCCGRKVRIKGSHKLPAPECRVLIRFSTCATFMQVIFMDNSMSNQLLDGMSRRAARLRCLFYMGAMASREGKVRFVLWFRKLGRLSRIPPLLRACLFHADLLRLFCSTCQPCVLIRYSDSPKTYLHKAERIVGLFSSLPVQLSLFLNLYQAPPGARRIFENMVVSIFEDFKDRESYREVLKSYIGDKPADLLAELSQYGLMEDCLPEAIGGSWDCSGHDAWLLSRVKEDRSRYACEQDSEDDSTHEPVSKKRKSGEGSSDDLMVMKARAERKRMMDRKYSEQRRQREKKEEVTLYNQYVKLNAKNKELHAECKRLQNLLLDAQSKVNELESARSVQKEPSQVSRHINHLPVSGAVGGSLFQQQHLLRSLLSASTYGTVSQPQGADPTAMFMLLQQQVPVGSNLMGGLASPMTGPQGLPCPAQGQHSQFHSLRDLLSHNQGAVGNS
jgi:hypothetical protein